jgi:hypothetical protein
MLKEEIIEKVKTYLEAAPEERDLAAGALLVLQLTNNRIMYQNFMRRPNHYASRIEYELQKKYNFYLQQLTHEQVLEMGKQVQSIAKEHNLADEHEEFKKGKRADHDALPLEIQALYAQNMSIMQQMRRCHTQLQLLSVANSTCPDSERYPFLKELIELDKQYHANWEQYDHFKVGQIEPKEQPKKEPAAEPVEEAPAGNTPEEPTPAAPADATPVKEAKPKKAAKTATTKASKPKAKAKA